MSKDSRNLSFSPLYIEIFVFIFTSIITLSPNSNVFEVVKSVISKHGADADHPVVGAASIVAKVYRDKAIEAIAKNRGFNVGSGYPSDPITRSVLPMLLSNEYPDQDLRWGWKTVTQHWSNSGRGPPPKRSEIIGGQRQSRIDHWSSASVKSKVDPSEDESDDI